MFHAHRLYSYTCYLREEIVSKILKITFLFLFFSSQIISQRSIQGRIINTTNETIPFANILLLNPVDSTLIKGELTDEIGKYSFKNLDVGAYILSSSYIGYNVYYSDILQINESSNIVLDDIILSEGITLGIVQVTAKKPLYEQKIDRLVVNVSNSITSAGKTALEVLEKSPGVIINQQSNVISLIGKSGVVIMINGRINYQPAESIVQMLASMSADNIESIELITTPPAHLDAEGNAGYINIVLKQSTDSGFNGNVSTSLGYGEGETGSAGINMNYRKGKINIFTNYNFSLQAQKQIFTNYREVINQSNILVSDLITDRDPLQVNHNLRLGADLKLSPKTIMGILISSYHNRWSMYAKNNSVNSINGIIDNRIFLENDEINLWRHFGANLNLEHKIGQADKINFNLDYLKYHDNNPNLYNIKYFSPDNLLQKQEDTKSSKLTPIDIVVGQIDYTKKINSKINLNTGLKFAHSEFYNRVSAELMKNGVWELIDQFTNESDLKESIAAGFATCDYSMNEKNSFKLGLRYEYSDSQLNTVKEGSVVDRQFGAFFPSVFYSRELTKSQSLNLSYSKRITRPTFNDMAPFAIFLDPNTFFFGNAGLQPAISNNYKIDYRYKSFILSLQYAKEDSTISSFQDRVDIETNQQLLGPVNLSFTKSYSANLTAPFYIGNKYTIQNNIGLIHWNIRSFYNASLIEQSITSFNLNTTHAYQINENHSAEISAFYNGPTITGRNYLKAFYAINLGFQKKFKNGSSFRFNIRDLLNSLEYRGGTEIPSEGFETYGKFDFSNRTFSISYLANFGNSKLKESRKRATGSDEERNRVN